MNLAVVAKSPPDRIRANARRPGLAAPALLSSAGSTFNRDHLAETLDGFQMPMLNDYPKLSYPEPAEYL